MRDVKSLLQALPYAIMVAYFIVFWWSFTFAQSVVEVGSGAPNEATGQTWHVLLRGGTDVYLTPSEWALFNAPFLLAPLAAIAGFLIWRGLWQSGFYDRQR